MSKCYLILNIIFIQINITQFLNYLPFTIKYFYHQLPCMSRANNEQMQPLPNQYIFLGTEIHKFYKEIRLVKSNIDDNILPHLTQQTEVLLCAFLPVCIPGTTCLWPGHKEFPTVLLGIDKIDSGCTGRSRKMQKSMLK